MWLSLICSCCWSGDCHILLIFWSILFSNTLELRNAFRHQVLYLQIFVIIFLFRKFLILVLGIQWGLTYFYLRVEMHVLMILRTWSVFVVYIILNLQLKWLKTIPICDIIHCEAPICISKVSLWYWLEAFLSSCVPHLHLNVLLVNFECLYLKVNANSRERVLIEDVICKS